MLLIAGVCLGQLGTWMATSAVGLLLWSIMTGFCSLGAQIMVPLAAHRAPEERRGQIVGDNMGGLIDGIILARPMANGLAAVYG